MQQTNNEILAYIYQVSLEQKFRANMLQTTLIIRKFLWMIELENENLKIEILKFKIE